MVDLRSARDETLGSGNGVARRRIRCLYLLKMLPMPDGRARDTISVEAFRGRITAVDGGYEVIKGSRTLFIPGSWCAVEYGG